MPCARVAITLGSGQLCVRRISHAAIGPLRFLTHRLDFRGRSAPGYMVAWGRRRKPVPLREGPMREFENRCRSASVVAVIATVTAVAAWTAVAGTGGACAQTYPDRPIKLIVPSA